MAISLGQYYDLLEKHDWYYMMSDDSRAYRAGRASIHKIQSIAQENPDFMRLYNEYVDFRNGKSVNKPLKPKEM